MEKRLGAIILTVWQDAAAGSIDASKAVEKAISEVSKELKKERECLKLEQQRKMSKQKQASISETGIWAIAFAVNWKVAIIFSIFMAIDFLVEKNE